MWVIDVQMSGCQDVQIIKKLGHAEFISAPHRILPLAWFAICG